MRLEYVTLVNIAIPNEIINSQLYSQPHQYIVKIIIDEQNYLITLSRRNAQYKFPFIGTFAREIQNIRKIRIIVMIITKQTWGSSLSIL